MTFQDFTSSRPCLNKAGDSFRPKCFVCKILGCKLLILSNTVNKYDTEFMHAVIIFIEQASGGF